MGSRKKGRGSLCVEGSCIKGSPEIIRTSAQGVKGRSSPACMTGQEYIDSLCVKGISWAPALRGSQGEEGSRWVCLMIRGVPLVMADCYHKTDPGPNILKFLVPPDPFQGGPILIAHWASIWRKP